MMMIMMIMMRITGDGWGGCNSFLPLQSMAKGNPQLARSWSWSWWWWWWLWWWWMKMNMMMMMMTTHSWHGPVRDHNDGQWSHWFDLEWSGWREIWTSMKTPIPQMASGKIRDDQDQDQKKGSGSKITDQDQGSQKWRGIALVNTLHQCFRQRRVHQGRNAQTPVRWTL